MISKSRTENKDLDSNIILHTWLNMVGQYGDFADLGIVHFWKNGIESLD